MQNDDLAPNIGVALWLQIYFEEIKMKKEFTKNGFPLDILPPTDDWVFKLLFGDERNKSMLIDLLQSIVELPKEDFELTFLDTHLKKEFEEDKLGILDVKVKTASGKIINIEIQVNPQNYIGKRVSFYKSRMVLGQIKEGDKYDVIQKVICILITSFPLFPKKHDYLNNFRFYNPKNNLLFEKIPEEIITLELSKLPEYNDGSILYSWLQFLKSRKKEDFEMVAETNLEIRKAVDTLFHLSADEVIRTAYYDRLQADLDRNSQLGEARDEGRNEGRNEGRMEVLRFLDEGLTPEEIKQRLSLK